MEQPTVSVAVGQVQQVAGITLPTDVLPGQVSGLIAQAVQHPPGTEFCACKEGRENPHYQAADPKLGMVCLFCNKPRRQPDSDKHVPLEVQERLAKEAQEALQQQTQDGANVIQEKSNDAPKVPKSELHQTILPGPRTVPPDHPLAEKLPPRIITVMQDCLSVRDTFACHALTGLLASSASPEPSPTKCANYAYSMADAMLKAREKQPAKRAQKGAK